MRILLTALFSLLVSGTAAAQLEAYAPLPRVWDAELSPNGRWLATGCSVRGRREICVYDLNGERRPQLIPSADDGRITGFYWPSDDYLVYWLNTHERVVTIQRVEELTIRRAISWSVETGESSILLGNYTNVSGLDLVPSSLTQDAGRVAMALTLPINPNGGSSNLRRQSYLQTVVYEVSLEDGDNEGVLHRSNEHTRGYLLDEAGDILLEVKHNDQTGNYRLRHVDGRNYEDIFEAEYEAELPTLWGRLPEGDQILIDFPGEGLLLFDPVTGERSTFSWNGEVVREASFQRDWRSNRIVSIDPLDGSDEWHYLDPVLNQRMSQLRGLLSERDITLVSWTDDRSKVIARAIDPGMPTRYYNLDITAGQLSIVDDAYLLPEGQSFPSRQYFTYAASDGLEIGGWLTAPAGQPLEGANLPLIVLPHGGPRSHDTDAFDWWAGYYASQGYLVMQPNFRGSSGYGREFVEAGFGGFGTRMIDDIIDGAHYLQAAGYARDGDYCAVGASYGGYAALMTGLRDPDNVACVVSLAGVSLPFAMIGSGSNLFVGYWEQYMGERFSDESYRDQISPARRPDDLTMPVLALHGDEDTTVSYDQFTALRSAMDGRDNARFITLEGEDHYLGTSAVRETLLRESGAFIAEHLPVD